MKIYLKNNSPTSIINWFDRHPPLGGIGKIKLAEAYLEQKKSDMRACRFEMLGILREDPKHRRDKKK